jgi:hypothetical protein
MKLPPADIECVGIIDSTTALQHWAEGLLNAWMERVEVSSLLSLNKLVLWSDRFYPTLVPDYRTDDWEPQSKDH